MTTNRIDIVPFGPELATPKLLFHLWVKFEDLFGSDTLYCLDDLAWTFRWNTLYQKVYMVFVGPNFNELNLIPLRYLKADVFQTLVNFLRENNPSILRRAYKVVEKYWNIVTFMDIFTHISKVIIFSKQSFGELTPYEIRSR